MSVLSDFCCANFCELNILSTLIINLRMKGSRISLISKKDIRYEGTLYSINENDATVALQNVRSYGTEGREKQTNAKFIPPQSSVHPYLLFRGMDIKDLHVHEKASEDKDGGSLPADPAIVSNEVPPEVTAAAAAEKSKTAADVTYTAEPKPSNTAPKKSTKTDAITSANTGNKGSSNNNNGNRKTSDNSGSQSQQPRRRNQRKKQAHSNGMVGTGASLLNRKTRGTVDGEEPQVGKDFDLESNTAKFDKDAEFEQLKDAEGDDVTGTDYKKDDFFDDISCDVTDRINGVNNRLRGAQERKINTETFGATSLKYYNGNRRGYNRRGGRGRGRGRGGGRRGPRAENQRWKRDGEKQNRVAAS